MGYILLNPLHLGKCPQCTIQIAVYEALSYEKIFECLEDEEFRKVIAPEEEKLLDQSRVKPAILSLHVAG